MTIHRRTVSTTAPDTLAPIISGSGGLGGHSLNDLIFMVCSFSESWTLNLMMHPNLSRRTQPVMVRSLLNDASCKRETISTFLHL